MAALALVLYVVWAVLAFGWRSWIQWRRTGDTGLRLHTERGSLQWWTKLGFVGSLVAGLAAPVAGLRGLDDVSVLDRAGVHGAGVVLALVGVVLTVGAQLAMGASWRVGVDEEERTALVTSGVFGRVRNPIYTAMLVTAFGLAAMVPNVIAVVALVALVVSLELQVRLVEEPHLLRQHGDAYARYSQTVGRFVPAVGRR